MITVDEMLFLVRCMAAKIEEKRDYLTELDQPIGDSDHGINMARGFTEVLAKLPVMEGKDIGTILKTVGMTLVSKVGGSSGPLYGSAYMKGGMTCIGKMEIDIGDFATVLEAAVEAVKQRGKSTTGEKTMLDSMVPATEALRKAVNEGKSPAAAMKESVEAAWAGVEYTKTIVATKGRASYVGERSLGHQDPGATSFAFLMEAVWEALEKKEALQRAAAGKEA